MNRNQIILTRARDKVARRWVQGAAVDDLGGVCAGYAIQASVTEVGGMPPATTACPCPGCSGSGTVAECAMLLLEAVYQQTGIRWYDIPRWNDRLDTTKAQVLAAFDLAIRLAKDKTRVPALQSAVVMTTFTFPSGTAITSPVPVTSSPVPVTVGTDKTLVGV